MPLRRSACAIDIAVAGLGDVLQQRCYRFEESRALAFRQGSRKTENICDLAIRQT
jgi:hypothetical protein